MPKDRTSRRGGRGLKRLSFDVAEVRGHGRRAWQNQICDTYIAIACSGDADELHGSIEGYALGDFSITRLVASQQRGRRTLVQIKKDAAEKLFFVLGRKGRATFCQDGRNVSLLPGDLVFGDSRHPFEIVLEGDVTLDILGVAIATARARLGPFVALTATAFTPDSPLQRLAFGFAAELVNAMGDLDDAPARRLFQQALDLLGLAVEGKRKAPSRAPGRPTLLPRLVAYIDSHLHDKSLSSQSAAAAIGVSSRYVNMLLESEQTSFRRYVLARRLDACRAALTDPARAHESVADIALGLGFRGPSHFARTFKERFRVTPGEFRAAQSSDRAEE